MEESLWTTLARRCHLSKWYVKSVAHTLLYGGSVDPWLDAIVRAELADITQIKELAA